LITQGSEKDRMQGLKEGGFKRSLGLQWRTIVTTSSNESIVAKITRHKSDSTAEIMRILEIPADQMPIIKKDWYYIAEKLSKVHSNYGHAGKKFAIVLSNKRNELRKLISTEIDKINSDLQTDSPERFWVQGIATIMVGARLALEGGVFPFKLGDMRAFLYKQVKVQRNNVIEATVSKGSLFADMLNDMISETLIVRSTGVKDSPPEILKSPVRALSIKIDATLNKIWISKNAVKAYSRDNKIPVNNILRDALSAGYVLRGGMQGVRVRLAQGTVGIGDSHAQTRVYELNMPTGGINYE